jgi:hypothetical protein
MNEACNGRLATTVPGPFGARIPERRQKGAPLRRLVCAGQPGDCPPGSTCDMEKPRCE